MKKYKWKNFNAYHDLLVKARALPADFIPKTLKKIEEQKQKQKIKDEADAKAGIPKFNHMSRFHMFTRHPEALTNANGWVEGYQAFLGSKSKNHKVIGYVFFESIKYMLNLKNNKKSPLFLVKEWLNTISFDEENLAKFTPIDREVVYLNRAIDCWIYSRIIPNFIPLLRSYTPRFVHSFHILTASPWPLMSSFFLLGIVIGLVLSFHNYIVGVLIYLGIAGLCASLFGWWRDVVRESTWYGFHTNKVRFGLKMGFLLFLVSEVMFFASWFWAYFYAALGPTTEIGCVWPPFGFFEHVTMDPFNLPLLNTIILLTSGVCVTFSHKTLLKHLTTSSIYSLIVTIFLGIWFTIVQFLEYKHAPFSICDSVFGSTFFMITGFHGFHVICGTVFLFVSCLRLTKAHFGVDRHTGYEYAIWYWHFVDIIWIIVFIFLYIGGRGFENLTIINAVF